MNIEKARLYTIGRLIGIYREQRRGKTQNSFTQRAFAKDICSVNTLKRLESGEVPRDEEVYIILLDKLGLKFGYYELVDNALVELMESLYEAIEYYRLDEIICLCERALSLLEKVKDYIYYNELHTLFEATYKYYKDDIEISVSMMKHFNEIYLYMDELYESLYKSMIFARAQIEYIHNPEDYYKTIKRLDILNGETLSERLYALHYLLLTSNYIKMKEEIDELEQIWLKYQNYIKLLDVYIYAIALYNKIGKEYRGSYINKALDIISNQVIPKSKITQLYSNLASQYYLEGEYELALSYFNKMLEIKESDIFLPFIVYIAHIQTVLKKPVNIPILNDELTKKYSRELQLIYNYYREYNATPDFVKQNFILKEIAPVLKDKELIKIFKYEITRLVENTNNYKNLYFFEKVVTDNLVVDDF